MSWRLVHHSRTSLAKTSGFYGDGTYTFLRAGNRIAVYRQSNSRAEFLGYHGEVKLPRQFPPISFPADVDQILAVDE